MAEIHHIGAPEIWKPVVGYEGLYEVSNLGVVKSLSREVKHYRGGMLLTKERILKASPEESGHLRVKLCREGAVLRKFVHQVVLEAFVGPRPSGLEGCHWDGNPANNRPENLRWDTRKENAQDSVRHGTQVHGERHYRAKLKPDDVREIRRLRDGGMGLRRIARLFGVSKWNVTCIVKGEIWKDVA